jgi:hypothetical protein
MSAITDSHIKQNRVVPLDRLVPHPRNYRKHPDTQIARLVASLARFGQGRSIVVQDGPEGYLIVAGHGVVEAAKKRGFSELRADILPADWTPEQIDGYLIADNLHNQDATDDTTLLAQLLQEQQDAGYDLATLGSSDESLREMLEQVGDVYQGNDEEYAIEDEILEEAEIRARPGDVWALGRHKIACIDSCNPEQVKRFIGDTAVSFVWADPPYGISAVRTNVSVGGGEAYDIPFGGVKHRGDVGGSASHIRKTGKPYIATKGLGTPDRAKPFGSNHVRGSIGASNMIDVGKYAPVIGDETIATAVTAYGLCSEMFPQVLHIWWGANYYAHALPPSKCWIVWDKENTGNFADAELAWCSDDSAVRIFRHMWNGLMKDSEKGQRRVHPTQKPVALAAWAFEKYGKEQDIIYDPFLGSGMSVIAAENLRRTVYGCELSPEYIDVIIARWEKLTSRTATLIERMEGPCA